MLGYLYRAREQPQKEVPLGIWSTSPFATSKGGGQLLGVVPLEAPSAELRGIGYGYSWQEGWASEENQAGDPLQEKECAGLGSPTGGRAG